MEYTLIRSGRKTLCIQVKPTLEVIVRAPKRLAKRDVDRFVAQHESWVAKHREQLSMQRVARPEPDDEQAETLRREARAAIPPRVDHYAGRMGLSPASVKITSARTRFGSCSGKNALCFSYRLMLYPPEAIDYVIVHELAHIAHKNHQAGFYALIASILPDYRARRAMFRG